MSIVKGWTTLDARTVVLSFNGPVPDKQILDLLRFVSVIDPAGIETIETKAAGTEPFTVAERSLGQRVRLVANPKYWRKGEPVVGEVVFTVFSENDAASAALESGAVDVIYGGGGRAAVRLRDAGYQLIHGPGPLVQVLRINMTRGPFRNAKFRQALNYLMDRRAVLRVGYAGLGEVTALPWAPAMYRGRIVETGPVEALFRRPTHSHAVALLRSLPRIDGVDERLSPIEGQPPMPGVVPEGCSFHPRCPVGRDRPRCQEEAPALLDVSKGQASACHFPDEAGMTGMAALAGDVRAVAGATVLDVEGLEVSFAVRTGMLWRGTGLVRVGAGVDLRVRQGETAGLVGVSDC